MTAYLPCRHLGPSTRTADCPTCQGHVQLKIFACELHAECTLAKKLGSIACCAMCGDFRPTSTAAETVKE